jgi:hypothetical protein
VLAWPLRPGRNQGPLRDQKVLRMPSGAEAGVIPEARP